MRPTSFWKRNIGLNGTRSLRGRRGAKRICIARCRRDANPTFPAVRAFEYKLIGEIAAVAAIGREIQIPWIGEVDQEGAGVVLIDTTPIAVALKELRPIELQQVRRTRRGWGYPS